MRTATPAPAPAPVAAPTTPLTASFVMFLIATFILVGRPQDFFPALSPLRLALVSTIVACVMAWWQRPTVPLKLFETRETKLYLLFFAAMIAGIPFAVYRPGAFEAVILQFPINVAFFLLFLVHVRSLAAFKRVTVVLVLATFMLTANGILGGRFNEGRFDIGSLMYDPNDVAFVEISLLAFSLWIVGGPFRLLTKLVAAANIGGGILIVLFTASRGGLLGLLTFAALFLAVRVNGVGKALKLAIVGVVIGIAAVNFDKINIDRLMTLNSIESDYNFESGGRVDIWERGWRLFLGSPLTGVGVNGFAKAIGDMRAAEYGSIPEWQTAHSTYVLALTELGLLGAIPFLLLLITTATTFFRHRRTRLTADLFGLPALLFIGFGAQLVSGAFLSQTYSTFFTLSFAASGALNRLAETADAVAPAPVQAPGFSTAAAPRRRPVAIGARGATLGKHHQRS